AGTQDDGLTWHLDSLFPRQEKNLQLSLVIKQKGDVAPRASVTYSTSSVATIHVHAEEPKIAVKVTSPEKLVLGDTATFLLTVSNPGDGPAADVQVHTLLSDGLEHARGKTVDFALGNLGSGESRTVQVV